MGVRKSETLLGTKLGMTQLLAEDGKAIPVTLIQAGPVTVTQVKTVETDGYNAVQVAFGEGKNLSKAVAGHVNASPSDPETYSGIPCRPDSRGSESRQ